MIKVPKPYFFSQVTAILLFSVLLGCQEAAKDGVRSFAGELAIENDNLVLSFDPKLYTRVTANYSGQVIPLQKKHQRSEYILLESGAISDFQAESYRVQDIDDELGKGLQYIITGKSAEGMVKEVDVRMYDNYPASAFLSVSYRNDTDSPVRVLKWVNHNYQLTSASPSSPDFWSFQGASYADRRDWIQPVSPGFEQKNYMGMNASDYGSGTPVSDVWSRDIGMGVGHVELSPKLVSLPVTYTRGDPGVTVGIEYDRPETLNPGDTLTTFDTFVNVHRGDYFATLVSYRNVMSAKGLEAPEFPQSSYEPIWCAWGYERDFTVEEVLQTLPKAKEMGLKWAVLDDGWQTSEGDWYLDREKFPDGDESMRLMVDKIGEAGLKAKLWWAPLAVDPGTDLIREHEDMLLLDKDGNPVDITWWDSYYLCPAYAKTRKHSVELIHKMMEQWGYAGLKIDGQHLNGVPPCYNPKHNHERPEESVEQLQEYWKLIYETAQSIDRDSIVEICPCGTSYAFHNMPYMNQSVSSDPESSWQIRHKGKTLKALMGESSPYYGDHVELSDGSSDFASSIGIGAVVGTKFTWPSDRHTEKDFLLTPEKEQYFQHWIDIYREKMLPKGAYMGRLYDIGFDKPETHAISKDGKMYYAFYAGNWEDTVELRGLEAKQYQVVDYDNSRSLGTVTGPTATLAVDFKDHLLLEASPLE